MTVLAVDTNSPMWHAVAAYCNERIDALTATCVDVESTASAREQAAYRIAELQQMLLAPRRAASLAQDRVPVVRGTY